MMRAMFMKQLRACCVEEMVLAQGLGDADRQAPRDKKGNRGPDTPVRRDIRRIWVDGAEFRWTRKRWMAA